MNIEKTQKKGDFIMNIIENIENGKVVLAIEGRLDTTTAPELVWQILWNIGVVWG